MRLSWAFIACTAHLFFCCLCVFLTCRRYPLGFPLKTHFTFAGLKFQPFQEKVAEPMFPHHKTVSENPLKTVTFRIVSPWTFFKHCDSLGTHSRLTELFTLMVWLTTTVFAVGKKERASAKDEGNVQQDKVVSVISIPNLGEDWWGKAQHQKSYCTSCSRSREKAEGCCWGRRPIIQLMEKRGEEQW